MTRLLGIHGIASALGAGFVATVLVAWIAALVYGVRAPNAQAPVGFSSHGADHFNWRAYVWNAPAARVCGSAWLTPRSAMVQWSSRLPKTTPAGCLARADSWLWPRPESLVPATFRSVSISAGFPLPCLSGGWLYADPVGSPPHLTSQWCIPLAASPASPPGTTAWLRTTVLPLRPDLLYFACNTVAYSAFWWGTRRGIGFLTTTNRVRRGLCRRCSHPAAGCSRCPECGADLIARSA
jgi:hypothetical protein